MLEDSTAQSSTAVAAEWKSVERAALQAGNFGQELAGQGCGGRLSQTIHSPAAPVIRLGDLQSDHPFQPEASNQETTCFMDADVSTPQRNLEASISAEAENNGALAGLPPDGYHIVHGVSDAGDLSVRDPTAEIEPAEEDPVPHKKLSRMDLLLLWKRVSTPMASPQEKCTICRF